MIDRAPCRRLRPLLTEATALPFTIAGLTSMGLDAVELVMNVEQTFKIAIDDRDAEKITTVGLLYQYVLTKIEGQESPAPTCKSAAVFYRVRRVLSESLGVERERVRLATSIEDLIPSKDRRLTWTGLEGTLGLRLPDLQAPAWVAVFGLIEVLTFVLLLAAIVVAGTRPGFPIQAALWAMLAAAAGVVLTLLVSRPIAVCLPHECRSVRGLVSRVTVMNYGRIESPDRRWNAEEVWSVLITLIGEQVGVGPDELRAESRFVDDLGLD